MESKNKLNELFSKEDIEKQLLILLEKSKNDEKALNALMFVETYIDALRSAVIKKDNAIQTQLQKIHSELEKISEYGELRQYTDSLGESIEVDI